MDMEGTTATEATVMEAIMDMEGTTATEAMDIITDMGMIIGTIGTTDIGTTAMGMDMAAGGMVAGTATV
jgi:hypothetical protein